MAEKKLTIVVAAKNATKAALSSVGDSLAKIGKTALNVGKMLVGALTGAAVAVGAFATKALMAWAKQESAVRALSGALTANGEAASKAMPELERLAAAIQDETGAADEATLAGMAKMRMLGVQTSKLGEAARAVIALKAVGMEETAAQKAVAMAMQGSYDLLQRYVPALRKTKDETEKARIVNDLFAKGYEQQKGLLNTVGGSWSALRGRISDAWEEVGKAISQNGALVEVLQKAADKVKELTARFAEWASDGGMIEAIATARQFGENMRNTFTLAGVYAQGFFVGGLVEPAKQAFQWLSSSFKALGELIYEVMTGGNVQAAWQNLKDQARGVSVDNSKAFAEMYSKLDAEAKRHAAASDKIAADQLAALKANAEKRVEIETTALSEITEAEEAAAEAAKKAAEERNAELKRLADEREQIEKDVLDAQNKAREEAWKKEKDRLEEELKLKEEVAKAAIKDVIRAAKEKGKADKAAAKDADKEAKRAALFEERKRKGGRLDKKQAEFLKAFQAREAARQAIPGLQDQINVANQNLAALQQQGLTLAQMLARLNEIDKHQRELLAMG